MDARYYLSCWLTKCKQNFQLWRHYVNTKQALQELCLGIVLQKQTYKKYVSNIFYFIFLIVCNVIFNNIFRYVVAVSFIGGGNPSTRRKPHTCRK